MVSCGRKDLHKQGIRGICLVSVFSWKFVDNTNIEPGNTVTQYDTSELGLMEEPACR